MSDRTVPAWRMAPVLLAFAACVPRGGDDPNPAPVASAADAPRPSVAAPDDDCGSASVHESRRGGKIDCFYDWNQGLAACTRGL